MGVTCQILINPPKEEIHIIGKSITGEVKYTLNKPAEYKKISLSLIGVGKCEWTQQKRKNLRKYQGNEEFVFEKVILSDNRTNFKVNSGTYTYPFDITLPLNIPPSVKTDICEIYYHIVLKFERDNTNKPTKKFRSKTITIHPNIPMSILGLPITFGVDKTLLNIFNSKRKPEIRIKGKLDKEYITPGRDSEFNFVVTNDSDATVTLKTELNCKILYTNDSGTTISEKTVLKEIITPKLPERSVANLCHVIPVCSEWYTVRSSTVMTREYEFKITVKLPLPHANAIVKIPVVIGERNNQEIEVLELPSPLWEIMSEDHSND